MLAAGDDPSASSRRCSCQDYAAFALVLRRAAQYFLIRRLTAFLAAADIFERLRTGFAPFTLARPPFRVAGIAGLTALPISSEEIALRMPPSCRTSCDSALRRSETSSRKLIMDASNKDSANLLLTSILLAKSTRHCSELHKKRST